MNTLFIIIQNVASAITTPPSGAGGAFLQHYWWFLVSLLGALLVFLLFVQGGQTLLFRLPKTADERTLMVNALGRKWEITFTTLVTFGGAAFASFPLFYSTSFGGAYWLWIAILFFFVIQAVSYEFRSKAGNFLGQKTYECFLLCNGLFGTILLGVAVAMFFNGAPFTMDKMNITNAAQPVISAWSTPWHGLEQVIRPFNLLLGLVVFFSARTMGLLFVLYQIDHETLTQRARKQLLPNAAAFVLLFVVFVVWLFLKTGYQVEPATGVISVQPYKYFLNMVEWPWLGILLLLGVVLVLFGLGKALLKNPRHCFWITGGGVVLAVLSILLCAAFNNTAYMVSTINPQQSLTIYNSSSSQFTLKVMAIVSLFLPAVIGYIAYVWHSMSKTKLTAEEFKEKENVVY